ncbi:MAG: hypothetical protein ACXVZO_06760 [Gaiellaceae bacterium]
MSLPPLAPPPELGAPVLDGEVTVCVVGAGGEPAAVVAGFGGWGWRWRFLSLRERCPSEVVVLVVVVAASEESPSLELEAGGCVEGGERALAGVIGAIDATTPACAAGGVGVGCGWPAGGGLGELGLEAPAMADPGLSGDKPAGLRAAGPRAAWLPATTTTRRPRPASGDEPAPACFTV